METSTINIILDIILILAGVGMVWLARGIGGVVGRTLLYIVIGALVTGFAHFLATVTQDMFFNGAYDGPIHRIIVLIGFVFLLVGFRQLQVMKR